MIVNSLAGNISRSSRARVNRFGRIRYQLGGALLLSAVLPFAIYTQVLHQAARYVSLGSTFVAVSLAVVIGHYLLRSLSVYPGVNAQTFVVPSFLASFGVAAGALVMTRTDYNRTYLFVSLILCVIWYISVLTAAQRSRRLCIGVVPFGDACDLGDIPGVEWRWLQDPEESSTALDGIVADLRYDLPDAWERRLARHTLDGLSVYHSKQLSEALTGRVRIDHLSENTFGSLMPVAAYLRIKLVLDYIGALIALPLLIVVLAVLWVVVKADSPGPLIYRQQRVGYRGNVFTVFKIRTMLHNVPAPSCERDRSITRDGDPRVTRVGKFLRRSRIDELPQILNILRGEMSWIGPRPEAAALSEWYEREIPFYMYRHVVRPGISGWAQVNQGHVAEVHEVSEKLENDFYYIKHFSPWLDALIIFRTIAIMGTGFGAR